MSSVVGFNIGDIVFSKSRNCYGIVKGNMMDRETGCIMPTAYLVKFTNVILEIVAHNDLKIQFPNQ